MLAGSGSKKPVSSNGPTDQHVADSIPLAAFRLRQRHGHRGLRSCLHHYRPSGSNRGVLVSRALALLLAISPCLADSHWIRASPAEHFGHARSYCDADVSNIPCSAHSRACACFVAHEAAAIFVRQATLAQAFFFFIFTIL